MSTLTVGIGQQFGTIAAAVAASQDGDVVQVQAGTYTNDFATINADITLEGVGGMVQLVATVAPTDGKAIITTNADVTIRNFEFTGAAVADGNGAGIRYQAGDLVIENSYFHHNQDGLLANDSADGTITIRNSEFASNGTGDGYTHNLYVGHIATLTVEDSYFHDAVVGHEIKSRASETIITDSRIADGDGTASYSVDLPNGGIATLTGNVIEQGANSDNPVIIHFGGEGNDYAASSLTVTDNVIVNDFDSASVRLLVNETAITAEIADNTLYGLATNQLVTGLADVADSVLAAVRPVLDLSYGLASAATAEGTAPETVTEVSNGATAGDTVAAPIAAEETGTATAPAEASADTGTPTGVADAVPAPVPEPVDVVALPDWSPASDGSWDFHVLPDGGPGAPQPGLQPVATAEPPAPPPAPDVAQWAALADAGPWHPVDVTHASFGDAGPGSHQIDPWG